MKRTSIIYFCFSSLCMIPTIDKKETGRIVNAIALDWSSSNHSDKTSTRLRKERSWIIRTHTFTRHAPNRPISLIHNRLFIGFLPHSSNERQKCSEIWKWKKIWNFFFRGQKFNKSTSRLQSYLFFSKFGLYVYNMSISTGFAVSFFFLSLFDISLKFPKNVFFF